MVAELRVFSFSILLCNVLIKFLYKVITINAPASCLWD